MPKYFSILVKVAKKYVMKGPNMQKQKGLTSIRDVKNEKI
jgi:hypothetical protein